MCDFKYPLGETYLWIINFQISVFQIGNLKTEKGKVEATNVLKESTLFVREKESTFPEP